MSTVTDILAKIDAKISAVLDDPAGIADYKIGDKSVSRSKILDLLLKAREKYQTLAEVEPYEDIRAVSLDFDDQGNDLSEYVGDFVE